LTNVATVSASRTPIGLDPQLNHQASPTLIRLQPCSVLWFGDDVENTSFLSALGLSFTVTSNPADLSAANLANYDVLVIAYKGPGVIGAHQADIAAFVSANNGLLIHQPNNVGALDYAPAGFGVTITDQCWCGGCASGPYDAEIVNGAHPITSGLANADLSGDFDSATSLGAGYTLLARNTVCTNNPALAAGTFGTGRVAFERLSRHCLLDSEYAYGRTVRVAVRRRDDPDECRLLGTAEGSLSLISGTDFESQASTGGHPHVRVAVRFSRLTGPGRVRRLIEAPLFRLQR
jgi:hypothetical protein